MARGESLNETGLQFRIPISQRFAVEPIYYHYMLFTSKGDRENGRCSTGCRRPRETSFDDASSSSTLPFADYALTTFQVLIQLCAFALTILLSEDEPSPLSTSVIRS